ncbi:MAG: ATP-binding cassette domain-containing protein [Pseudoclavibacter sp.]
MQHADVSEDSRAEHRRDLSRDADGSAGSVDLATRPIRSLANSAGAPLVEYRAAELRTKRGQVYGPLNFVSSTRFVVLLGNRGDGRTALQLCAAGRMHPSAGEILTEGIDIVKEGRRVRRLTGIVAFRSIDDLEPRASISDLLRERTRWATPWWKYVPRFTEERTAEALRLVFGEIPLPSHKQLAGGLTETQEFLFKVVLALIEHPEVLVIDDLDQVHDTEARAQIIRRLETLNRGGVGVLMVSSDERDFELTPPLQVDHELVRIADITGDRGPRGLRERIERRVAERRASDAVAGEQTAAATNPVGADSPSTSATQPDQEPHA